MMNDQAEMKLPRGIWYERDRERFRIRKYRNGRAFVQYRDTLGEALQALKEIESKVQSIPKLPRGARQMGVVPVGTFSGLAKVARQPKY
jgi:adenylate cyclase class IV